MTIYEGLAYSIRQSRYKENPLPDIETSAGALIPGALVRLVGVAAVGACIGLATLATGKIPVIGIDFFVAIICIWALIHPCYEAGATAIGAAAFCLLISPGAPFNPLAPWIILTGYLGLRLMMTCHLIAWKSKVAPVVLLNWRDAVIAVVTAAIGLVIMLPGGGVWAVVLGLVTVLVLAGVITWHFRVRPQAQA